MTERNMSPGGTLPDARVEELLARMTLEEKAALTVGRDAWTTMPIERLGVPSVWLSDGPTGLRMARGGSDMTLGLNLPATCFPTESALGSSWDVELVGAVATAIAVEAQAAGVQMVLGPGVNLKRSPLCGRNFEYFSEDPVLSGELAAAFVSGLQERGVGACVKHLVANESETDRMIVDSVVDERTLRELYLRPFEIAIAKSDPWSLMEAYNRLNGTHCAENEPLLRDIVAGQWGYRGIIVSDWFAVNDRPAGIAAGLHLQMPFAPTAPSVVAAVREGRLAEQRLDEIVRPLLAFVLKADASRRPDTVADLDHHHRLARRAAAESIVLLKNEGNLLPLGGEALSEVALLGAFAVNPRFQGAGSSQVVPARPVETVRDQLVALAGSTAQITYAAGYRADGEADSALLAEARELARRARTAIVVVGLPGSYEVEGADRHHLDLPPGHNALVEAVLAVQPRTVVVLVAGSAIAMPWVARAPSLLSAWLGGQASGGAIVDVLLGHVNPSGKLAETFPARLEDTPAFLNFPDDGTRRVTFGEGLFAGYRWYDARRIEPLVPFGHGLSYTTFSYGDLTVDQPAAGGIHSDDHIVTVTITVQNNGARPGMEIVQLYVGEQRPRLQRPEKDLKAFAKVALEPGESKAVSFRLGARDFSVYDPVESRWTITSDSFDLLIGASSRDIRLRERVVLAGFVVEPAPLGRLSPLRDWLAHPATRDRVRELIGALLRQFFGVDDTVPPEGVTTTPDTISSFITNMPITKLVMFGVLSEADLAQLIAATNAHRTNAAIHPPLRVASDFAEPPPLSHPL
jgi:beta-glucosidase